MLLQSSTTLQSEGKQERKVKILTFFASCSQPILEGILQVAHRLQIKKWNVHVSTEEKRVVKDKKSWTLRVYSKRKFWKH